MPFADRESYVARLNQRAMWRLLVCFAAVIVAAITFTAPLAAQQVDVIRGRVIGPDSIPLENVTVTATSISGNVNRVARSDRSGRFTITFPGGDGDYFVSFASMGYTSRRFEVKRTADEEILVADAKLARAIVNLDSVQVVGRTKPDRVNAKPDISGTERPVDNSAVPADQMGDIAAMAASQPGVQPVAGADGDPSGFSVLGLTPDQNATTLNGLPFAGNNLPRDANIAGSLVTTPYDVSRGGFSGAQFNIQSRPGSNFIARTVSLNADAPQMQWTDRAGRALGQQYTGLSLGGLVSGPIKYDQAFYNVAYQLGRRANGLHTLLNTDPLGLQTAGIATDSVTRLLGILQQAHIPTTLDNFPSDRLSDQGALFGSFDWTPTSSSTGQAFNVSLNGSWNRQTPVSALTTEFPAHSGDRTSWSGGAQARHSDYVHSVILSETTVGVTESHNVATPYLLLPSGTVLVNSSFADGTAGVKAIAFGGSPSLNAVQTNVGANFMNQLSWFSLDSRHRVKLTSELRRDEFSHDQTTDLLGSFAFNSLTALQAGEPSFFTRQLSPHRRSGSQFVGALSLGDSYKRTSALQIQYGLRLDGNRFASAPLLNPDVERTFGVRNDNVPSHVYLSPRGGFSWAYGTAPEIGGFEGAMRGPRAVVRGGIGMFQNTPSATLIGSAIDNTGLPGAVQQITCAGAAAPIPDWNAYAANPAVIPSQCADGTNGSLFASSAPNVFLFARDYTAARSLRSNLQWNGPVLNNRFSTQVEGTYSLNMNQPGPVDLNFNPVVRFALPDEAGRPVFVQPTSIVAATGTIASRDARVSQLFNRVTELRSDLKSESRQISLHLSPTSFSTHYSWGLSYVYSNVRERTRGFSSTVGNPLGVEWARGAFDSRHQITYNLGYNFFDAVRVNWFGNFRSGLPFTPLTSGDVNGDGYSSNDRAFIFDPARTSDPVLASGVTSLLAGSSGAARDCLARQLGRLAARNSCESPWTSSAVMSISFNPVKVRLPRRATLSFQISNPLGAADLLLHGESGLHGWGQLAFPDPTLLYVRGFDPTTRRFRYEVNQRFGATSPLFSAIRMPVTVTAMMHFDIGPARERQVLTQQLDRGRKTRGTRTPEMFLKAMYGTGGIPNPMTSILRQADTLALTGPQADSIATMNRRYVIRLDSIWAPVAKYLATLPDRYDQGAAYGRYREARQASVDLLIQLAPAIRGLLSAEQRRKLPEFVASYLDTRYLAAVRSGTAGALPGSGITMSPSGGGYNMTITR